MTTLTSYSSFFQNLYNVFMYNVCTCVSHCTLYSLLTPIPFRAMGVDTLTVLTSWPHIPANRLFNSRQWFKFKFHPLIDDCHAFSLFSFWSNHFRTSSIVSWHCLECRFAYLQIVLDSRLCWQNSGPALITENVAPRGQIGDSDCTAEPLYPRIRIHQILLILTLDPQKIWNLGVLSSPIGFSSVRQSSMTYSLTALPGLTMTVACWRNIVRWQRSMM